MNKRQNNILESLIAGAPIHVEADGSAKFDFELTPPEPKQPQRTAEEAMSEIWAIISPPSDGPEDYNAIVDHVTLMQAHFERMKMFNEFVAGVQL